MTPEETEIEDKQQKSEGETETEQKGDQPSDMDSGDVDQQMKELEEDPPDRLEDWPDGPAKYRTIGGGDANEEWEEGPTRHLGPSDVRYYEDGSVSVHGEKVDNPEDFKGDPIPGGPTDPDAPDDPSGITPNDQSSDESKDADEGSGENKDAETNSEKDDG